VLLLVQAIVLITGAFPTPQLDISLFSAIASFIASLGLCPLLFLEHARSIKPSDLAVVYLLASFTCDSGVLAETVYDNGASVSVLPAMVSICLKFVLLVAESQGKERILRGPRGQLPPEQLAGVLGRTFFWWINPILAQGNRNILTGDSLPPLDYKLSSKLRRHRAL
jgi:ATP-binding cassette, subfamily C (CFTR/MRP), member 1